ncbi:MAG: SCP2 sterol-binding domain-containing protein [Nitrincola lacisaponensis]|uniref:SCP-2 sterol transfer family protein n=1 Tax=Nitrincola lacisaponensis TaxID=267850 RepID=A0A063Y5J4_9GAMM|nr:SCP2 sterol-binding domain-containing protein [Nitrincola lacisaponensis]KDE40415.1 SCP-2 sterol transfer family protein [Nitrincola lacisaponensis]
MKSLLRTKAGQRVLSAALNLNAKRYKHQPRTGDTPMADLNAVFAAMEQRFNPAAAGDLQAVFQYQITDGDPWAVTVDGGSCKVEQIAHDAPTVTLTMDSQTLEEVMSGETDGMQAFMTGRIQADGDIMLATRLASLFPL